MNGPTATAPGSAVGAEWVQVEAARLLKSDVLTASEVARLLRVNIKTVYENARAGAIPAVRLGRSFRFSRSAILASLATCKSASHQEGR